MNDETQLASYDCGSDAATVCSSTNYLTLVLQKGRISATDYNFQLQILQEKVGSEYDSLIHDMK
ncbi:hypothetical protein FSP39_004929 [Pinctada imbricata]|uniref:Uncharacterized protein n=1 Tax=Pinctada imbricata TaxID=66713 RepID=A0AA88YMH1_PINIB|nr:hypothetical protein FSP39_004929 [Pinctada imbricata]